MSPPELSVQGQTQVQKDQFSTLTLKGSTEQDCQSVKSGFWTLLWCLKLESHWSTSALKFFSYSQSRSSCSKTLLSDAYHWSERSRALRWGTCVHTWLVSGQVWIQNIFKPFQPGFLSAFWGLTWNRPFFWFVYIFLMTLFKMLLKLRTFSSVFFQNGLRFSGVFTEQNSSVSLLMRPIWIKLD